MRTHRSRVILVGLLLATFLIGGCAQNRPCMIIPAQIELARAKRDQVKAAYDKKLENVERSASNLEVSQSRLDRLVEERDQLLGLLEEKEGGEK